MKVPFLDLESHHAPLRAEIDAAIGAVIDAGAFAGGPFVEAFEKEFARYCQTEFAVGVGSGTEALWFALLALGVGPGDEVITVPSSFMATAEAITYAGATPVFVDILPDTYTMDPAAVESAITPRTKGIVPVHLFGQPADMDPIIQVAREHGLFVVEDACQAHGAEYKGRRAGGIGDAGCFSFYPGKNLGAFGEAGAVVTNQPGLRDKMAVLRDHGQVRKYHHTAIGWNGRMDGIQAAVLQLKLKRLDMANAARRKHAAVYQELLRDSDTILLPVEAGYAHHVFHVFAVRVKERAKVMCALEEHGIGCGIHYPVPIHLQDAYASLGYRRGAFPVAEQCADEFLSLPMFPELRPEQVRFVADTLREAVEEPVAAC